MGLEWLLLPCQLILISDFLLTIYNRVNSWTWHAAVKLWLNCMCWSVSCNIAKVESFVQVIIAAKFTALSIWTLQFLRKYLLLCLECFNLELWWWPPPMLSSTCFFPDSQDFVTMTTALSGHENSSKHGKCPVGLPPLLQYYDSMVW